MAQPAIWTAPSTEDNLKSDGPPPWKPDPNAGNRSDPPRLLAKDVRHLALEGGGGKGFAYLGAIEVLEQLNILGAGLSAAKSSPALGGQIQGFAGASAGAITSMLLSTGMTASDIREWMTGGTVDFSRFFDDASLPDDSNREAPARYVFDDTSNDKQLRFEDGDEKSLRERLALLRRALATKVAYDVRTGQAGYLEKGIDDFLSDRISQPPMPMLSEHFPAYLSYLWRDMGFFSGDYAYTTFFDLLRKRVSSVGKRSGGAVTFAEHKAVFGVDLVVLGSNLTTGKTVAFGPTTTPDFDVALAVRVSMSLPFIFKPVRVSGVNKDVDGLYVDGGVWNNTPADAFPLPVGGRADTLVLRLEDDQPGDVHNLGEFIGRYLKLTAGGSGESQFGVSRDWQAVVLDTNGLSTTNFTPPPAIADAAVRHAHWRTEQYFKDAQQDAKAAGP